MKRDAIPTPGSAAQPATVGMRNTRAMLNTARQALLQRDYGLTELAEHIQAQHPERTLNMVNLVERLVQLGEIELVDDKLGLTEAGEREARLLGARRVGCLTGDPAPSTETERRAQIIDRHVASTYWASITGSQRRAVASAADLAPPPMRHGTDIALALPSRIGNELHYRDGRVTRMDGTELQPARRATDYRPTRDHRNAADRLGYPDKQFAR